MGFSTTREHHEIPEFLGDFLDFETENQLFSKVVKGRRFWDYVRYTVTQECIYSRYSYQETQRPSRISLVEAVLNLAYIAREKVRERDAFDLMVVRTGRTVQVDGHEVSIYSYPLIRHLAGRRRILFIDPSPLTTKADGIYPCSVLKSRPWQLLDRMRTPLETFSASERALFADIGKALEKRFGLQVDIERIVREQFLFQMSRLQWYRGVLAKYNPQIILYSDDANCKGLIEAAHEAGIPTADMQHSLISSSNILYRYPKGIERLPTISDFILTFGEFWNSQFDLPSRRRSVGFPFFELKKAEALQAASPASKAREKSILIVAMTFSKDVFIRVALALSKLLPGYTIYYKLRPEDFAGWRERYPAEFGRRPNLVVIDSNDTPLYRLFASCAFQIGVNSTALCEGMGFGLTTFILKTGWYREMEYFYQSDHVFLVDTAEEIADKVAHGRPPTARLDMNSLFKPNALQNLEKEIDGIIAGGKCNEN